MPDWGFETRQIHAGAVPDPTTGARAVPIYQTTSYTFRDTAHAAALFGLEELGNIYTRIMNPTQAVFEERIAVPRGRGGRAGRGQRPGGRDDRPAEPGRERRPHRLVGLALRRHLQPLPLHAAQARHRGQLRRRPRRSRRLARRRPAQHQGLLRRDPRQPQGRRPRLRGRLGRRPRPPASRSWSTTPWPRRTWPSRCSTGPTSSSTRRPSSSAATARRSVASSSTAARSTTRAADGFPASPSPTRATTASSSASFPQPLFPARFVLKARLQYLRDTGPAIAPLNSFLFLQGLETLSLRMERHVQNATAVAQWLEARDEVAWVAYPGLESSPWHARQQRYLPKGGGAIIAFGIEGGADAGRRFIEGLELFSHLANVGDVRSLAIHPASTTHSQLTEAEQTTTGVTPDLVRLSVGHRVDRGHPGRPRGRVPRRQGSVTPGAVPGSLAARRRSRPAPVRHGVVRRRPRASSLEGGGLWPRSTVAYETWGELERGADQRRPGAARPDRRLPRRRAGRARAIRLAGWWDGLIGPGAPIDTRPVLRRLPERARRLPGNDRARVGGPGRDALRIPLPGDHHPGPGRGRGGPGRPLGIETLGRRRRRLHGRDAGPRVVRRPPRPCGPGRGPRRRGGRHAPTRSLCARCRSGPSGPIPAFAGGDYYGDRCPPRRRACASPGGSVSTQLPDRRGVRGPVRADAQDAGGPLEGRPLRHRVVSPAPRGEAGRSASTRTPTSSSARP